jgi:uncharacterized membrane protein YgcG
MRRTTPDGLLALVVVAGVAASAFGQPPASSSPTGVRDGAKMFAPDTVEEAQRVLRAVEKESRWQTRIETVASLEGTAPRQYAADAAKKAGVRGLYVLIAKNDKKIQVEPSESARTLFSPPVQKLIVSTFVDDSRRGENGFNTGLQRIVALVRRVALGYGVLDHAKLFDEAHKTHVDQALNTIRERLHVVIETVESLGGKPVKEVALANAGALHVRGLYVLIAAKDRKVYVEPSESVRKDFPPERTKAITDAIVNAFKAQDDPGRYDKGLTDAVALIGKDLGIASADLTGGALEETLDDSPSMALTARPAGAEAGQKAKTKEEAPDKAAQANRLVPAASGPAPGPVPAPAPNDDAQAARPAASGGSILPLVLGGLGVLVALWLLSRLFRRSSTSAQPPRPDVRTAYGPGAGAAPAPAGQPGYGPPGPGAPPPGPRPGYGPAPPPGYGYGSGPPPAAGGGGGFLSGALGGLGGAIAGNILYDKFGRPHPTPSDTDVPHAHGAGALPPEGGPWPQPDPDTGAAGTGSTPTPTPTPETYDPNAGTGGDWGTSKPGQDAAAETDPGAGSWGAPEPEPSEESNDGDGTAPEPEPDQAEEPAGGDWSSDAPDDTGGGDPGGDGSGGDADTGGADGSGGGDDNQGGGW